MTLCMMFKSYSLAHHSFTYREWRCIQSLTRLGLLQCVHCGAGDVDVIFPSVYQFYNSSGNPNTQKTNEDYVFSNVAEGTMCCHMRRCSVGGCYNVSVVRSGGLCSISRCVFRDDHFGILRASKSEIKFWKEVQLNLGLFKWSFDRCSRMLKHSL